jgi:hypothetical protein
MLHEDTLRWLNTLRMNERLKLKHIPISIAHELLELGLARVSGGNLVITTAGLNGSLRPRIGGRAFRVGAFALN